MLGTNPRTENGITLGLLLFAPGAIRVYIPNVNIRNICTPEWKRASQIAACARNETLASADVSVTLPNLPVQESAPEYEEIDTLSEMPRLRRDVVEQQRESLPIHIPQHDIVNERVEISQSDLLPSVTTSDMDVYLTSSDLSIWNNKDLW